MSWTRNGARIWPTIFKEHYRPFMEYVERLLRRPDANRKIYALVEDDEKCGYKYAVLTIKIRNANGSGFGYPWNLRHPSFEKDPPSALMARQITSRFIKEIIDNAKAAGDYSVSIRLDGALDRRFALAKVPNSPSCFEYHDKWLFIRGFTP